MSDKANIPDEWVQLAHDAYQERVGWRANSHDLNPVLHEVLAAVAPAIRQQAMRDVCEALRHRWPSSIGGVAARFIERKFLPDVPEP